MIILSCIISDANLVSLVLEKASLILPMDFVSELKKISLLQILTTTEFRCLKRLGNSNINLEYLVSLQAFVKGPSFIKECNFLSKYFVSRKMQNTRLIHEGKFHKETDALVWRVNLWTLQTVKPLALPIWASIFMMIISQTCSDWQWGSDIVWSTNLPEVQQVLS